MQLRDARILLTGASGGIGQVLVEQDQGEGALLAPRDAAEQANIRQRMPVQQHRRFFSSDVPRPIVVE